MTMSMMKTRMLWGSSIIGFWYLIKYFSFWFYLHSTCNSILWYLYVLILMVHTPQELLYFTFLIFVLILRALGAVAKGGFTELTWHLVEVRHHTDPPRCPSPNPSSSLPRRASSPVLAAAFCIFFFGCLI